MVDADLVDLVDLADLNTAAQSAINSHSFVSFCLAAKSFGAAEGVAPVPPPPARQTTPTTLCEEGGTPTSVLESAAPIAAPLEALTPAAVDTADDANAAADDRVTVGVDGEMPTMAISPPADLVARRLRLSMPWSGGPPAGTFDAALDDASIPFTNRSASPIKHIPDMLPTTTSALCFGRSTSGGAMADDSLADASAATTTPPGAPTFAPPPLMPLPSWSRAPSFSFALF